jgi:hypothetical protein
MVTLCLDRPNGLTDVAKSGVVRDPHAVAKRAWNQVRDETRITVEYRYAAWNVQFLIFCPKMLRFKSSLFVSQSTLIIKQ